MTYENRIMQEIAGCLARTWVLLSAPKSTKEYVYVDGKWVEITIRYNGELDIPRRRVGDRAKDLT
jgi:hypothetical protein